MRCVCFALLAHAAAAFDLMSAVLKSPIYKNLLVPASRNMMINTAKENGVPWADAVAWIRGATTWELDDDADVAVPAYYRQPFHAYEPGNLCWEAAWEAEVAGRAVGGGLLARCGFFYDLSPVARRLDPVRSRRCKWPAVKCVRCRFATVAAE